jgi:hypothetical protein
MESQLEAPQDFGTLCVEADEYIGANIHAQHSVGGRTQPRLVLLVVMPGPAHP